MLLLISVTLLLVGNIQADSAGAWNYIRTDADNGPESWNSNVAFPECAGASNSPIAIQEADSTEVAAVAWELTGWDTAHSWTVDDKHRTFEYGLEGDKKITTEGGGLVNKYNLLQFHYHWGGDNTKGSEHTLNGKEYPMEVHFVHWNSEYATAGEAIASEDADALAVLGFFFEIQAEDNDELAPYITQMEAARNHENYTTEGVNVDNLSIPVKYAMTGNYYRYMGGLTTPGCNQIVRWTVFDTTIKISAAQMSKIRTQSQTYLDQYGEDFYRDPQPIGSRIVAKYDVNYLNSASLNVACLSLAFLSVIIKYL